MPFHASPMFPGDLYDTTLRLAATAPVVETFDAVRPGQPSDTWRQFLELGWQAVLIDEAHGGVGATLGDMVAIAEAAGRHALPAPLAARCAVVPTLLSSLTGPSGSGDSSGGSNGSAAEALLRRVATGEASACPVFEPGAPAIRCRAEGQGWVLDGTLRGADLTEPATDFLITASDESGGVVLLSVGRDALRGTERRHLGIDARQTVDIALAGVFVPGDAVLARGAQAVVAVERASAVGALIACAQTVGAIGAMIEQTIEFLGTREQFGVALATFQALRHKVVEMYVAYENIRGMVRQLVSTLEAEDGDALRQVALVKLYLAVTGRQVAETAIQLHGGIGMSRELPVARLAMHALSCSLQWGDRFAQLDRLAADAALH